MNAQEHSGVFRWSVHCSASSRLLIVLQVVRIQIDPTRLRKDLSMETREFSLRRSPIIPPRGLLYDRRGNLLAGKPKVYEVGVELQFVEDAQSIAHTVEHGAAWHYADAFIRCQPGTIGSASMPSWRDNVASEKVDKLIQLSASR